MWTARNRLILAMLIFGGVLNYADRQIIAVLKPMLQADLHWTDLDYGRLTSVFQLASAIAFLGSGWLVDRVGWRRANPLAVGLWSLAAMAHAVARTVGQFTVARLALGATEALGTPTAVKTIAAVFRNEERSLAFGIMNAANTLGAVITPLLIPLLALKVGWANSFLITGGLGLVWVAVWLLVSPGGAHEPVAAAIETSPAVEKVRWRVVLADRRTWAIAGAKVLSDQVWWLLLFWMPDLFHRVFHLGMQAFGAPLAVIYFISGIAETNRAPFDVAEGESEIVAGFHVEYSGAMFATLFALPEYANMIMIATLTSVMFFGGWLSPIDGYVASNSILAQPSFLWLAAKIVFFLFCFLWFRATFPRYRYDQIMRLGWKVFIPLTLVWIFVEGVMVYYHVGPWHR